MVICIFIEQINIFAIITVKAFCDNELKIDRITNQYFVSLKLFMKLKLKEHFLISLQPQYLPPPQPAPQPAPLPAPLPLALPAPAPAVSQVLSIKY